MRRPRLTRLICLLRMALSAQMLLAVGMAQRLRLIQRVMSALVSVHRDRFVRASSRLTAVSTSRKNTGGMHFLKWASAAVAGERLKYLQNVCRNTRSSLSPPVHCQASVDQAGVGDSVHDRWEQGIRKCCWKVEVTPPCNPLIWVVSGVAARW